MQITFGNSVQDFYLEQFRRNQAERKARLAALKTREDAEKFVADIRKKVRSCFHFPAEKCPLNAKITGTVDYPEYTLEKVLFHSRENYPVSANLYLPKNRTGKVPAVLFLCGHSAEGKAYAGYQKAQRGLAQRGFAVLSVDPVGQGERHQFLDVKDFPQGNPCREHNILGKQMLLNGDWFGEWRTYDAVRGLDYLLSRPEIDPARIGVHGSSGGGTLTSWASAVDDRFFAAAPSCFVTTWVCDIENELPSDIEQCPPDAAKYGLEIVDFLIASAPRPYLLLGQANDFFDPRGLKEIEQEMRHLYKLLGCEDRISMNIGGEGHSLSQPQREAAFEFFCKLAGLANPDKAEGDIQIGTDEEIHAAPGGEVVNIPGEKKLHDLILEKSAALKAARKTCSLPEMRRILIEKLGMDTPSVPHVRVLRPQWIQLSDSENIFFSRFGLETEPGKVMTLLHRSDRDAFFHIHDDARILLYIPHLESISELGTRLETDSVLYSLDMRGIGECTPTTCNMPPAAGFFDHYGYDFHYTALANMFGKTYLGGKVKDILCAVEMLSEHCPHIELEGHGQGAIPALIAAVLSDKIKAVRLTDAPESWESMQTPRLPDAEKSAMSVMIPGILEFFDLPDLRKAVADKIRL